MLREAEAAQRVASLEQWIAEARQGSRAALDRLLEACLPYLRMAAHRVLGAALRSRLDAADVVQETLIEACRDFPCFRGNTEKSFFAWLRQILHNNLTNERRRHIAAAMRSVRSEVPLNQMALSQLRDIAQGEWDSPSKQAQAQERSEALERALLQLPEKYRQVLLLRTWEELTFAEVGERLHCSAGAARKLWGRAAKEFALVFGDARGFASEPEA
jgi:RNA polymerase sigma-70 factor (ECF subfamily)